jgi:hypothetical protein
MFAPKGTPEINTQGLHAIPTFTVQILAKNPSLFAEHPTYAEGE